MKLAQLDLPIEEPTGAPGVAVLITHVGRGVSGLPRARITVWNGQPLTTDVIEPDVAADRRRLAKAAAMADPSLGLDAAAIETTLVRCAEALHTHTPAGKSGTEAEEADRRPSATFPGLVDIVAAEDGEPIFLILDPGAEHGVSLVREYRPVSGPDVGAILVPPAARALPWHLPRAVEVARFLAPEGDSDPQLFADVVATLKRHALFPTLPQPHADAYYELGAAWVFHTYYLEIAAYSPLLAFAAVPERGKSRAGRTLVYAARRGVHTETLREANLFRDSQDRGATLFLDCKRLWAKAEKLGCEDILLQRFERGARVSRVLYPERGAFDDTVYFDIFGPTVLASNEPLGRILDTRCIPMNMPLASDDVEYPVPDEAELLPLRERLTAWRASQLIGTWQPLAMRKPAPARLGDVLLPLAQIINYVAPDRLPTFEALARHLQAERRRERALSWEGAIITASAELADEVHNGLLLVGTIAERVNVGRPEREQLTNKRIGDVLRTLGLELRKAHGNRAAVVWDGAEIERLVNHYESPGADA